MKQYKLPSPTPIGRKRQRSGRRMMDFAVTISCVSSIIWIPSIVVSISTSEIIGNPNQGGINDLETGGGSTSDNNHLDNDPTFISTSFDHQENTPLVVEGSVWKDNTGGTSNKIHSKPSEAIRQAILDVVSGISNAEFIEEQFKARKQRTQRHHKNQELNVQEIYDQENSSVTVISPLDENVMSDITLPSTQSVNLNNSDINDIKDIQNPNSVDPEPTTISQEIYISEVEETQNLNPIYAESAEISQETLKTDEDSLSLSSHEGSIVKKSEVTHPKDSIEIILPYSVVGESEVTHPKDSLESILPHSVVGESEVTNPKDPLESILPQFKAFQNNIRIDLKDVLADDEPSQLTSSGTMKRIDIKEINIDEPNSDYPPIITEDFKELNNRNSGEINQNKFVSDSKSSELNGPNGNHVIDDDDRTLLDVFAEAAKEFLTKKMIKNTDASCDWDWKSLRCEPSTYCSFQYEVGDYHFGRSCRRRARRQRLKNVTRIVTLQNRPVKKQGGHGEDEIQPTKSFQDISIGDRITSLGQQIIEIVMKQLDHLLRDVVSFGINQQAAVKKKFIAYRSMTCENLWSDLDALKDEEQRKIDNNHNSDDNNSEETSICFTAELVPVPNLQERILCGQIPDFPICDDEFVLNDIEM